MAGFSAEIDLSKLDKMINKLENNLQRFVDKSKDAQQQVVDAFNNMGTRGVDKFIGQLSTAINQVMEIGKKGAAIKWDSQNLNRYIDQVNQLITLIQQYKEAGWTLPTDNLNKPFEKISTLKEDLKLINELLSKGEKDPKTNAYRQLTADEQNYLVELRKNLQEQLKIQNQSIQERLGAVRKALQQELKETQDAENKKTKARQQSYKGSIKYSDNAQSLEQERQAIRNLEAARESLKKTDSDYAVKLEELNKRINAHRINVEAATKTEAQRNALTSSTRAEYARLLVEQDKLRQSYEKLKNSQATLGTTSETTAALQNIVKRYRDVYAEILRYKQSANGQLDATERKFLADQAALYAENEKRKTDIAQQEAAKRATITSAEANRVISNASSAKNVNQRLAAIQELKNARDKLDSTDANYTKTLNKLNEEIRKHQAEIDKARGKTEDLDKKQRGLMDTAGQLQRKLALLFSVSAIQGYINKLVEVRGEFEMQQRSLQTLLQNKDEANELWDKTVALAVKSPFRIKDLVTYTKQLAAYRVESDKLYDTNRMLADVSAGLGVDMNRLILAYGQVKAANYLRGTELRQFSEAGVNMLGELAKYFTEVEGRAVSVGDVFERVSKRMVSFENVNEIFKRITSEGGIFFKMQEKQSETLKGMIMNFRDSMDLMLNEIGKDQDSILKNAIRLAKDFVDNWRQFAPLIKTIGISFLAAFGVKQIANIANAFGKLFAVLSANPILLLASAAGVLAAALYSAHAATSKLQAAMNEVNKENTESLEESIELYRQLTDVINDSTKSYEEQNKAKSQLKNKFKDILPDQYLEVKYVEQLKDNYKDAEQAMFDYYNAKAREQKKARIEQNYEGDLEGKRIPNLVSSVKDWIGDMAEVGNITEEMRIRLTSGVSRVINSLVEDVKNGKIASDVNTFNEELKNRLSIYSGIDLSTMWSSAYTGVDERLASIQKLTSTLREYASDLKDIQGLVYETYDQEVAANMINQEKNNLNTAVNAFNKASELYRKYVNAVADSEGTVAQKREEIQKDVQKILTDLPQELVAYSSYLEKAFAKMKEHADAGKFHFASVLQTIESEFYATLDSDGKLADGIAKIAFDRVILNDNANDAAKGMVKNFQEGLSDKAATLKQNDFQKAAIEGAKIIAEQFGISTDVFAKYVPKYGEAFSEVKTRIKADVEYIETLLKAYDTSITTGAMAFSPALMTLTDEEVAAMRKNLPALKEYLKYYGEAEKGKKNRDSLIDERIKVIDQMNKKYKELNKTLSKTESLQGAFDAYKDAFASAYNRSDVKQMTAEQFAKNVLNFPNENDIVKWLKDLAETAKNTEDRIKVQLKQGEYEMDLRVRTKIEDDKVLTDQIEEMFSGYELSLELQKLNIPPDLAKQLFGIDSLSLSELRNKLTSMESQFIGTGMEDKYKEYLKKISEMEDKAQMERLKKYTKYLLNAQSERVKIELDTMRQIAEIDQENKYSSTQKETIKRNLRIETQEKIDKQQWDDFKNSEMYTQMFEDLESLGNKAIANLITRLESLKDSLQHLPATELKEIMSQIQKLQSLQMERNPFAALRDAMKDVRKLQEKGETESYLQNELQLAEERRENAQNDIDAIDTILNARRENLSLDAQSVDWQEKYTKYLGMTEDMLNEEKRELGEIVDHNQKISKSTNQKLNAYNKARKASNEVVSATKKWGEAISEVLGGVDSLLDAFGVAEDDASRIFVQSAQHIADMIVQTVILTASLYAMGVAANSSLGVIGWIAMALQAVAMIVASLFSLSDKKKERQIQKELELVEQLEKQYEKLEKAIEDAYSISGLGSANSQAQRNINAQIQSYKRMIALEEDKKKTDNDKIKEWRNAIDDLKEQAKELNQEVVSAATAGIMDSVLSASQEFTDAWLEAFNETGNGLSGLEDNFKDTMLEMVKQQASMLISQSYVERWKKQLEQYINPSDLELSTDEAKKWVDAVQTSLPQLNAALENYFHAMQQAGVDISGGKLSGLQKGIQGITEETAQIIEAYLNSIRFFVAENNTYLSQIASAFSNGEMENPMVSQLRVIAQQTSAINTLLQSLTKGGHSLGGVGLKVFIS